VTISFYTFFFAALSTFFMVDTEKILHVVTGDAGLLTKTIFLVLRWGCTPHPADGILSFISLITVLLASL